MTLNYYKTTRHPSGGDSGRADAHTDLSSNTCPLWTIQGPEGRLNPIVLPTVLLGFMVICFIPLAFVIITILLRSVHGLAFPHPSALPPLPEQPSFPEGRSSQPLQRGALLAPAHPKTLALRM